MAKIFDIDVVGFIQCADRAAIVGDTFYLTIDSAKYPTAPINPIPADVTAVVTNHDLRDEDGNAVSGHTYTLSVEDANMPPNVEFLENCDITLIMCADCCQLLEEDIDRNVVKTWEALTQVQAGDKRLATATNSIYQSLSTRVTGAAFDNAELANWVELIPGHDRLGFFGSAHSSAAVATTINTLNVWEVLNTTWVYSGTLDGLTPNQISYNTGGTPNLLIGLIAQVTASLTSSGSGDVVAELALALNGTPITATIQRVNLPAFSAIAAPITIHGQIPSMVDGDVLTVVVRNTTDTADITAETFNLTHHGLGIQ